jgi:hypothetical protein
MFDLTARDVGEHIEEYRRLAREQEDRKRARDGTEHRPRLANTARMVKLHAIFRNPYHELAADGRSALDMMEICALNLTEREDFKAAGKLWSELARYRHVRMPEMTTVRRLDAEDPLPPEHPTPEPTPTPPPPPPEPSAPAEPLPPLRLQTVRPQNPFEHFIDSLPARQRADMILLQEKEAARPPNGPNAEQRFMSYKTQLQRDTCISGF